MGVIQFKGGSIQFKGGTIQFKNLGKVADPTINAYWEYSAGKWFQRVDVTNNDTETVTIYADEFTTPPTTSRGDLAGGASTTITIGFVSVQPVEGATFVARVQMKATGRTDSAVISDTAVYG